MQERLSQLFDKIMSFCREQTDIVMIAGAVLVVLIIIIAVVKSSAKRDRDDDLDFDEDEYFDKILEQKKLKEESKPESETAATEMSKALPKDMPLPHKCKQQVIFPEELLNEIARVSSKDIQEIEIKIQSAELKVKYAGCKDTACIDYKPEERPQPSENRTEPLEEADRVEPNMKSGMTEQTEEIGQCEATEEAERTLQEGQAAKPEDVCEEVLNEFKDEAGMSKSGKFGPENLNTARSGRIFTEEELEKQIRD